MHSIVSLELDDDCILPDIFNEDGLFFRELIHLTHIRITLFRFKHSICLLNQLGSQLCSLAILCPNLKQLAITIYRTIRDYETLVLALQRLSNVEYLTLLLAIDCEEIRPHHFIDGFDLEDDIISYMPHLRQFHFHIRSILKDASHAELDTIRQSFVKQQQSIDFPIDYFDNNYGQ
ncbi:unnamed protein product, partial [Rotaria magnacalcarata]